MELVLVSRETLRRWMIDAGQPEKLTEFVFKDTGNPTLSPNGEKSDLWTMSLDGIASPTPFLESRFEEEYPRISADGSLLAYVSNDSGNKETYLTRYPSGEGKWLVSAEGGTYPVWSPAGGELYFIEDVIARGIFTSIADLRRKLVRYIRHYNNAPKPIKWMYRDPTNRFAAGVKSDGTVY
jgi:hypothetical protein